MVLPKWRGFDSVP